MSRRPFAFRPRIIRSFGCWPMVRIGRACVEVRWLALRDWVNLP